MSSFAGTIYDAVVVGAGPAGSSCALRLARSGLRTAIVERSAFPRTKVCGEYLNTGALDVLAELGVWQQLDGRAGRVCGIRLYGAGTGVDLPLEHAARSLPRSELDAALLRAALEAGAELIRGRVEDVGLPEGARSVRFRDSSGSTGIVRTRILVGADGIESIVARKSGLSRPIAGNARFALGGHYRGFGDLDGYIEMYVERDRYFAINPFDSDAANVMIVVPGNELAAWRDDLDARLRETAERLSAGRRTLGRVALEGKRVAIGPLFHRTRAYMALDLLLIGDAATFVDPFTGQGVYLALASARDAAEAIVESVRGGTTQARAWRRYAARQAARIADRRRVAALVKFLVRTPAIARRAARNLAARPELARRVVEAVTARAPVWSALTPSVLVGLLA
jgi:flavin-dependent dehydrogenase